ncbi:hypothetical protein IM043_gp020 [Bacillus phage SPG24]|nr:hypothetical protein IM043_gp020 [Bacillus phage SPG24]
MNCSESLSPANPYLSPQFRLPLTATPTKLFLLFSINFRVLSGTCPNPVV